MPDTPRQAITHNTLLAALAPAEFDRIVPQLEVVALERGQILDARLDRFHFLVGGLASLAPAATGGNGPEAASVGCEGGLGLSRILAYDSRGLDGVVLVPTTAYALAGDALRAEFARSGGLQAALLSFAHTLMAQISQRSVCTPHHMPMQRLGGWLLSALRRLGGDDVPVARDIIADILGMERTVISDAARGLERKGIITVHQEGMRVLDKPALVARSCRCYEAAAAAV